MQKLRCITLKPWNRGFQPSDISDPSHEEIDAERYADLDESREGELSHIAGWFDPNKLQIEGMLYLGFLILCTAAVLQISVCLVLSSFSREFTQ